MAKQVSPGVLALRKVVDDVHKEAREAKARGELVGWSSSKFPCELAAAFDLHTAGTRRGAPRSLVEQAL